MPLKIFDFPMHTIEVKYPQSSTTVTFGGGYDFVSKPNAPDQVRYTLHFETMKYFVDPYGAVDRLINPTWNIAALEDFYREHRLYEKFVYPHPVEGNLIVRFGTPLTFKSIKGGGGAVEPFSIELVLQP